MHGGGGHCSLPHSSRYLIETLDNIACSEQPLHLRALVLVDDDTSSIANCRSQNARKSG